jgi:hypothetical protein
VSLSCFEIRSSASRIALLRATRRVARWPYGHGRLGQLRANCRVLIPLFRRGCINPGVRQHTGATHPGFP